MEASERAAAYARAVVDGALECDHVEVDGEHLAPKYVKLQCADFLRMWNDEDSDYIVDRKKLDSICKILGVLVMAKGPHVGKPIADALAGFQWLIVVALLCCVHRADTSRRRYRKALLEICRKNGKTFIVAVLFILLFFLEPEYSRFFSVAPDGALAKEIKEAIEPLISTNAEVLNNEFKVTRDYILNKPSSTRYVPLNYSTNRMDGREPNVYIADEIGALPSSYPIDAMESGQLLVDNPLGFCISTKYPTIDNPAEEEVEHAKKVLDGVVEDRECFALLYEPDDTKPWMDDDAVLAQGNPLALEIESVWLSLIKKRAQAIEMESKRENFLTKHCNIIYQGAGTESYVPIDAVLDGSDASFDFTGRELYVGVDLAMTNDNCAVAVAYEEDGELFVDVTGFIPAEREAEKTKAERFDYRQAINASNCIACGEMVVDYATIEDFVLDIPRMYGGDIVALGYDRYNALSSVQKWEEAGINTIQIEQHSRTLHPATKLLSEFIESRHFHYRPNKMLEVNFQNARCTYDTNLNRYITKKRSNGKVDMVFAILDAVHLIQQDLIYGDDFVVQYD